MRNIILAAGWPVLIAGSLYLLVKGMRVYKLVKGSLVGKIVQVLVTSMLVGMYSLGIVATAYLFCDSKAVYIIFPVFVVWFGVFIWTLKALNQATIKADKLSK